MSKVYTIFDIKKMEKTYKDGPTTVLLKPNGYVSHDGISGDLNLSMPDEQSPEWNTFYLVTVEQVQPEIINGHYSEGFHKLIEERKAKDAGAVVLKSGRKFRE